MNIRIVCTICNHSWMVELIPKYYECPNCRMIYKAKYAPEKAS